MKRSCFRRAHSSARGRRGTRRAKPRTEFQGSSQSMNFRNVSSWCIRNPVFPIVLFVGLMLAGLVAFARMQVNNAPDIDFPAAFVTVSQPGAAPNEVETQITQRVESAIRGVNGVEEINSSVTEGNSTTFVNSQIGTPTD